MAVVFGTRERWRKISCKLQGFVQTKIANNQCVIKNDIHVLDFDVQYVCA